MSNSAIKKPNIFKEATSELSQDGFFTWLIKWANDDCKKYNEELNETAKDFARLLLSKPDGYKINKVDAVRQWNNIDIKAVVNDKFFIGIEDKTNTGEHSGQLERYRKVITDHCDNQYTPVLIYLTTGNESLSKLNKIRNKGYTVIDRKAILQIFNNRPVANDIYNEFKDFLSDIENATNSFKKGNRIDISKITSSKRAAEGFYLKLQEHISKDSNWGYVSNPTGGFLGFWYHGGKAVEVGKIYVQIENSLERGIKLTIKISKYEQNIKNLRRVFKEIIPFSESNGLAIAKPDRFRVGEASTLAIIQNAFQVDEKGDFDFNGFLIILSRLEKTINDYLAEKTQ